MIDQLMILAESGAGATEGIPAAAVGIGAFIILLALLGITFLTGGKHQSAPRKKSGDSADH